MLFINFFLIKRNIYPLFYNSEYEQIRNKQVSSIQSVFKERLYFLKTIITQIISRLNKHGFINLLCSVVKFKEKIEVTDTIIKPIPVYQF